MFNNIYACELENATLLQTLGIFYSCMLTLTAVKTALSIYYFRFNSWGWL